MGEPAENLPVIPGYKLESRLGKCSQANVYKGVQVSMKEARSRHLPNQTPSGPKCVQPLHRPTNPFSTGVEQGLNQVGGIGDEVGHQVGSVEESVGIHGCGDNPGGRNPPLPGRLACRDFVIRAYTGRSKIAITQEA